MRPPPRLVALAALAACGGAAAQRDNPADAADPDAAILADGRALTRTFYGGDSQVLWSRFSPAMKDALGSLDDLAELVHDARAQLGAETAITDEHVADAPGARVYQRTARFAYSASPYQLSFAIAPDTQ